MSEIKLWLLPNLLHLKFLLLYLLRPSQPLLPKPLAQRSKLATHQTAREDVTPVNTILSLTNSCTAVSLDLVAYPVRSSVLCLGVAQWGFREGIEIIIRFGLVVS